MYSELKKVLDIQLFSYSHQLMEYAIRRDYSSFGKIGMILRDFSLISKRYFKAIGSKANTDKRFKHTKALGDTYDSHLFKLTAQVNVSHQQLQFFCKILFMIENDLKYLEDVGKYNEEFERNFPFLIKSINMFDSTDRETMLVFNKLRNLLCHTSIEQAGTVLDEDGISKDIFLMADSLQEMVKTYSSFHQNAIADMLADNIKKYCTEDMINVVIRPDGERIYGNDIVKRLK